MEAPSQRRIAIPVMDGIRGWACLLVMIAHAVRPGILPPLLAKWVWAKGAVIIFFALCGFMMMYHYYTNRQLSGRHWAAFGVRRFFRIYPPFALAVVLYCLFPFHTEFNPENTLPYLLLSLRDVSFSHLWTIPPEVTFYLIFPVISCALFVVPLSKYGKVWLMIIACIFLAHWHEELCMIFRNFNLEKAFRNNVQYFLAGMIAAYIHLYFQDTRDDLKRFWNIATCCALAFMVVMVKVDIYILSHQEYVLAQIYNKSPLKMVPITMCHATVYITVAVALLLICAARSTGAVAYIFTNPFIRYCGTLSYSLYLIHPLIFILCSFLIPFGWPLISVVTFGLTFLAAMLMHYGLERPSNSLGKRLSQTILAR